MGGGGLNPLLLLDLKLVGFQRIYESVLKLSKIFEAFPFSILCLYLFPKLKIILEPLAPNVLYRRVKHLMFYVKRTQLYTLKSNYVCIDRKLFQRFDVTWFCDWVSFDYANGYIVYCYVNRISNHTCTRTPIYRHTHMLLRIPLQLEYTFHHSFSMKKIKNSKAS